MTWQRDYEAAWKLIDDGLGGLGGQHLLDARAFVGDVALLALMREHGAADTIVTIAIEIVRTVLQQPVFEDEGDTEREVRRAHERLVACEGDQTWRRTLPAEAETMMRAELSRLHRARGVSLVDDDDHDRP